MPRPPKKPNKPSPKARLVAWVPAAERAHFERLATKAGMSNSELLARAVDQVIQQNPLGNEGAPAPKPKPGDPAPKGKYTLSLTTGFAAQLEQRARQRNMTVSGYAAHVLRAHLRASPPMPASEFETLKRLVNELAGVRALMQEVTRGQPGEAIGVRLREALRRVMPALPGVVEAVQALLLANAKSWEAPDG